MSSHDGENWPYHEDKHGNMVPCASNPCSLHGGGDIIATSLGEAYEKINEDVPLGISADSYPSMEVQSVIEAVVGRSPQRIKEMEKRILDAAFNGAFLFIPRISSSGEEIDEEPLPVIGLHVSEDEHSPIIYEVDSSYAGKFSEGLNEVASSGNEGAQVTPESEEEMSKMRMFVSPDGYAGAAIKADGLNAEHGTDGDYITAVHRRKKSRWRKTGTASVMACVANGGKRLDCYDGFLPKIYQRAGFHSVARVRFNKEYAPDGWNYDKMHEPDVVFMTTKSYNGIVDYDDYDDAYSMDYDISNS